MSECVADEMVESVVNVAVVEKVGEVNGAEIVEAAAVAVADDVADVAAVDNVVNVPLMATVFAACVEEISVSVVVEEDDANDDAELEEAVVAVADAGSDTGIAVAGFVNDETGGKMANRSLLFNGSKADCEDRLSTELQLIERVESSSTSSSVVVVVVFVTFSFA